jgi:hypothetical protein
LRYFTLEGQLVPTSAEDALQAQARAQQAQQQAQRAQQAAKLAQAREQAAQARADRLAAQLSAIGIDPAEEV